MKASGSNRKLFFLRVGVVEHSKLIYITDMVGGKIYVEAKDVDKLIAGLGMAKNEVENNG